jgi:hypothetical protein
MDDLITWLRAQLDDDERTARACGAVSWVDDVSGMVHVDPAAIRDNKLAFGHLGYVAGAAPGAIGDAYRAQIARHDPARVLREVEAKRAILDGIQMCHACGTGRRCIPHDVSAGLLTTVRPAHPVDDQLVRLLASPFSDRPGYREEWKP